MECDRESREARREAVLGGGRLADRQAKGGKGKKPKPKGESQCHVWPSLFLVSGLGAQT